MSLLLVILPPGAFAQADPLVLERVEVRRVLNNWGLQEFAPPGYIRIAVEDCKYLGHYCTIRTEDGHAYPCRVVDCNAPHDRPLSELGIVADVGINGYNIGDQRGTVIIWRHTTCKQSFSR